MNAVNKHGKYLLILVLLANLTTVSFAGDDLGGITSAMQELCEVAQTFLGIAIAMMILLAGAIYAFGQIMGAETRARATVWATSMLTGAVIGALIFLVVPFVIALVLGVDFQWNNPCSFTVTGTT